MFDDYTEMFGGAVTSSNSTMIFLGLMCVSVLMIIIAAATGISSVMNVAVQNQKDK